MHVQEKITYLPNPELERKPCVDECDGCLKIFEREITPPEGMILVQENVCVSYADPKAMHRLGCPMKTNREISKEEKKRINPLKASKRLRRRGIR